MILAVWVGRKTFCFSCGNDFSSIFLKFFRFWLYYVMFIANTWYQTFYTQVVLIWSCCYIHHWYFYCFDSINIGLIVRRNRRKHWSFQFLRRRHFGNRGARDEEKLVCDLWFLELWIYDELLSQLALQRMLLRNNCTHILRVVYITLQCYNCF